MMTVPPRRPSDATGQSFSSIGTASLIHLCTPTGVSPSNPYLLEMDAGPDHYNVSFEDTEQHNTGIYSSVDEELVDTDDGHSAVFSTSSTTHLTVSAGSPTQGGTRNTTGGKKSPRASRVPEVPAFVPKRKAKSGRNAETR